MREPVRHAITIRKGSGFRAWFAWKYKATETGTLIPVDLAAGYRARSQFRVNGTVVMTLDSDPTVDPDGPILLGEDGSIDMKASVDVIDQISAGSGQWSVELTPRGGQPIILLEGRLTVFDRVTEPGLVVR